MEEKIEKLSKLEQKMAEAMLALDKRVESLESKLGKPTKRAEKTPTRKPLKKSK